jgi:subtilisin family serine protease
MTTCMSPLELVELPAVMDRTSGRADVTIGLIDGPVARDHPDLAGCTIRVVSSVAQSDRPFRTTSPAGLHGTAVAGVLSSRRGSGAPAICPDCTLLVRPIFAEATADDEALSATPEALAQAILDCVEAGARVLNISAALAHASREGERALEAALDRAARRDTIVVAAAGNQQTLKGTAMTRHRWVLPVVAYGLHGRPLGHTTLGHSIGRRGLGAPGEGITSVGAHGAPLTIGGTSAAAPFVTGTIALLLSEFPAARSVDVIRAVTQADGSRRTTVVPPLLNAWAAYLALRR